MLSGEGRVKEADAEVQTEQQQEAGATRELQAPWRDDKTTSRLQAVVQLRFGKDKVDKDASDGLEKEMEKEQGVQGVV
uniref:Uncharacterized protein n=1 Tax=Knipowitschia caucasica TaxID=637954 RepID=A0AAV2KCU2_KNICA